MERFDEGGSKAFSELTLITGQKTVVEGDVKLLRERITAAPSEDDVELWGPSVGRFSIQAGAIASIEAWSGPPPTKPRRSRRS